MTAGVINCFVKYVCLTNKLALSEHRKIFVQFISGALPKIPLNGLGMTKNNLVPTIYQLVCQVQAPVGAPRAVPVPVGK